MARRGDGVVIVALLGCHGAGKTTLGNALAARLGWTFHDEIVARFALDPRHRPGDVTAADAQEAFDEAVIAEELARDAAWDPRAHRLVETWHPGNLAFASLRSAAVVDRRMARVVASIERQPVAAIEVGAPDIVLAKRRREPGSLAFFRRVGDVAVVLAARLDIPVIARVRTHRSSAEELADELASVLHGLVREGGPR